MTNQRKRNLLLRVMIGLGLCLCVAAAQAGPKETLQRYNGELEKLLRKKVPEGSPEEAQIKDQVKKMAALLLDYGELTKRSLADNWTKMTPKQRTDFVHTLQDVIERNYVKQLKTNLNYQVIYGAEEIQGEEAKITSTIKIQTKGKSTNATIEYRMIKRPNGWMVYDVITDDLSLVRNYRSQFQRIISSSGYDGLLDRMKKKAAEDRAADESAKDDDQK